MKRPKSNNDYAETLVLDIKDELREYDPEATAVLDEEYRRELEAGSKPSKHTGGPRSR